MTHERKVRVLREWTKRTFAENAKRAANRAWYLEHIGEYRAMSESEQFSEAGTRLRDNLFDRLREGIDPLPIPTVSDLVNPHSLGFCCRYACNETCVGCGDFTNGGAM